LRNGCLLRGGLTARVVVRIIPLTITYIITAIFILVSIIIYIKPVI